MRNSALLAASALAATVLVGSAQAQSLAYVTGSTFVWTESGTVGGSLTASSPVYFDFSGDNYASAPFLADFTLLGVTASAETVGAGGLTQYIDSGTFTVSVTSPVTLNGTSYTGTLLSGTFTEAVLSGPIDYSSSAVAGFLDSGATGSVTYVTSVDPNFPLDSTSGNGFSFGGVELTSFAPSGSSPATFTGQFSGDFEAGSGGIGGGSGVPEPASWALMILGAASVGAALRRRTALVRRLDGGVDTLVS
jgi:hypothetical protein